MIPVPTYSAIPAGTGKSVAVAAITSALVQDPAYAGVGFHLDLSRFLRHSHHGRKKLGGKPNSPTRRTQRVRRE